MQKILGGAADVQMVRLSCNPLQFAQDVIVSVAACAGGSNRATTAAGLIGSSSEQLDQQQQTATGPQAKKFVHQGSVSSGSSFKGLSRAATGASFKNQTEQEAFRINETGNKAKVKVRRMHQFPQLDKKLSFWQEFSAKKKSGLCKVRVLQ